MVKVSSAPPPRASCCGLTLTSAAAGAANANVPAIAAPSPTRAAPQVRFIGRYSFPGTPMGHGRWSVPHRLRCWWSLDGDADRVEGRCLVGTLHHRDAVAAVAGPGGALEDALLLQAGDLDLDLVGLGAAALVLGRHEERGYRIRVGCDVLAVQLAARGVEVAADQTLAVQLRHLDVVAALGRREEPVADQVLGTHLDRERLVDLDLLGSVGDQQRRVLVGGADLAHVGGDAAVALLEAVVLGQLAVVLAGLGDDVQFAGVGVLAVVLAVVFTVVVVLAVVVLAVVVVLGGGHGAGGEVRQPLGLAAGLRHGLLDLLDRGGPVGLQLVQHGLCVAGVAVVLGV